MQYKKIQFNLLPNGKFTKRKGRELPQIEASALVDIIRKDTESLKARKEYEKKGRTPAYDRIKSKLKAFQPGEGYAVLDAENLSEENLRLLDKHKKHILLSGRSVNGLDRFFVIPTNNPKEVEKFFALSSSKGQASNDRIRYIANDPDVYFNPKAEVFMATEPQDKEEYSPSLAPQYYVEATMEGEGLDNGKALSVFMYKRNRMSFDQTVTELEKAEFDSASLKTKKDRLAYYKKWETMFQENQGPTIRIGSSKKEVQVEEDGQINVKKIRDNLPGTPRKVTDVEFARLVLNGLVSAYIPVELAYYTKRLQPVAHSIFFVGEPSSGKGYIETASLPILDVLDSCDEEVREWREDNFSGVVSVRGQVKSDAKSEVRGNLNDSKKKLPNLTLSWGFEGSSAAMLRSLSEIGRCLIMSSDFASTEGSLIQKYNSGLLADILKITEGERITKVNNKSEYSTGKVIVKDYAGSVIVAGTPGAISSMAAKYAPNGFASRFLYVEVEESDDDKEALRECPDVSKFFTKDMILNLLQDKKPIIASYDEPGWIKELKKYLKSEEAYGPKNNPLYKNVNRGVRDSIKRAAIERWIKGERKDFYMERKEIEKQLEYFYLSQRFIDTWADNKTDFRGNSLMSANIKSAPTEEVDISELHLRHGVSISPADRKKIVTVWKNNRYNTTATAMLCQVSTKTILKVLRKEGANK